jgi:hypothetical protein
VVDKRLRELLDVVVLSRMDGEGRHDGTLGLRGSRKEGLDATGAWRGSRCSGR